MNVFWKGATISKIVNINFWQFVNIFWKGATVSKIVNILAVCEHFPEGSCYFKDCEHFGSL